MKITLNFSDVTVEDVYDIISAVEDKKNFPTQKQAEEIDAVMVDAIEPEASVGAVETETLKSPYPEAPLNPVPEIDPTQDVVMETLAQQESEAILVETNDGEQIEVDSLGLPWDKRIHAGTKTKTAKGIWKRRRNISNEDYDKTVIELRKAAASIPVPGAPKYADLFPDKVSAPSIAKTPTVPEVPVAPMTPTVPPVPTPNARDFTGLVTKLTNMQANEAYVGEVVRRVNEAFTANAQTITDIANDAGMVEYAWQCLDVDEKAAANA